jgi:enterochelin esterase-like enzyme
MRQSLCWWRAGQLRAGYRRVDLPEPQSTLFFLLLMAIFGALVWWLVVTKQMVFRVLAACLAFIPAMLFGVAAVNKYYGYYQNWNAAIADISSQGVQAAQVPGSRHGTSAGLSTFLGSSIDTQLAEQTGFTLHLTVHGRLSNITRSVYVYLPPQYFSAAYRTYRFPVIELLHGFPGLPQDWITVLDVTTTLKSLINDGKAKPVVLVMPDANGGARISLQCLNQVGGPQDATFLAQDLPAYISRLLRVQPPGASWGVAGYSEGGFCAANLGLRYLHTFGYAGVLSGYFAPDLNQLDHPSRLVNAFGGNKVLQRLNTPVDELKSLPARTMIPQFWLGAGSADSDDVRNAEIFDQLLQLRQPAVTLRLVPGGGHTAPTWRALLSPMLQWMTGNLAHQAAEAARAGQTPKATHTPKAAKTAKTAHHPPPKKRHPAHAGK